MPALSLSAKAEVSWTATASTEISIPCRTGLGCLITMPASVRVGGYKNEGSRVQVRWDTRAGLSYPPIPLQCKGRCSRLSCTLNFLPLSSGELCISRKRFQVLLLAPLRSHCKSWGSWLRDVSPVSVPPLRVPHALSSGRAVLYWEQYLIAQKM